MALGAWIDVRQAVGYAVTKSAPSPIVWTEPGDGTYYLQGTSSSAASVPQIEVTFSSTLYTKYRISVEEYQEVTTNGSIISRAFAAAVGSSSAPEYYNEIGPLAGAFEPSVITGEVAGLFALSFRTSTGGSTPRTWKAKLRFEVFDPEAEPPPPPPDTRLRIKTTKPEKAKELDRGWSFDGKYIPHFLELNWYFGDNPVDFRELNSVRIHGLTKGNVKLAVSTNGMETDSDFYAEDYSEAQHIDLPRKLDKYVTSEYMPVSNYEQPLNRGISVQMKFEGRNEDMTKPEPSHVIQVLVTESSPIGNGNRSN